MSRVSDTLLQPACLVPFSSATGVFLVFVESHKYGPWRDPSGHLLWRIRAVVTNHLFVPVGCLVMVPVLIVLDIVLVSGLKIVGKSTAWKTSVVALALLFVSLPVRIICYSMGMKEVLFPIDFKRKTFNDVTHPILSVFQDRRLDSQYVQEKLESHPLSQAEQHAHMDPKERLNYAIIRSPEGWDQLVNMSVWGRSYLYDDIIFQSLIKMKDPHLLSLFIQLYGSRVAYPYVNDMRQIQCIAVEKRSVELIDAIVGAGYPVNNYIYYSQETLLSKTIRHAVQSPAIEQREYLNFADFLIRQKGANPNVNAQVLFEANENLPCLAFLAAKGVDLNVRFPDGFTALTFAVLQGRLDLVQFLLEKKVDVGLSCQNYGSGYFGRTPIELARHLGYRAMIDLLAPHYPKSKPAEDWAPPPMVPMTFAATQFNLFPPDLLTIKDVPKPASDCLEQIRAGVRQKDPWAVFGLDSKKAKVVDIERAFRKLSLKIHPDKNPTIQEFSKKTFVALKALSEFLVAQKK